MQAILSWFSRHRRIGLTVTVAYFAFLVLSHDLLQQAAFWAQGHLDHRRWNTLVTIAAVVLLMIVAIWVTLQLRKSRRAWALAAYSAGTVALMAVSYNTLFVMNIEAIHFPQYAILAILIFSITRRYGETVIWTSLAGVADEAYQYFVLYADRSIHFDFNDTLLNVIGGGGGLLVVALTHDRRRQVDEGPCFSAGQLVRSWAFRVGVGVMVLAVVAAWGGRLRVLAGDDGTSSIVLRRGGPSTMYWTPTTWGKTYHEVLPFEGAILLVLLTAIYVGMDFCFRPRARRD